MHLNFIDVVRGRKCISRQHFYNNIRYGFMAQASGMNARWLLEKIIRYWHPGSPDLSSRAIRSRFPTLIAA